MKNKSILISYVINILLIVVIFIILFIFLYKKEKDANKIFYSSINSIVELKANTKDNKESFGTAFFITNDGKLLTAAHVVTYKVLDSVYKFDNYYIRFADENDYYEVKLLKYDIEKDLALLELVNKDIKKYKPLILRKEKVEYGEKIYSIGNGLNQGISITNGIISLPLVDIKYNDNNRKVIQMNIIVNEGNSGGPILDKNGHLIGLTSFRKKDNLSKIVYGLGYSIPISDINKFLNYNN